MADAADLNTLKLKLDRLELMRGELLRLDSRYQEIVPAQWSGFQSRESLRFHEAAMYSGHRFLSQVESLQSAVRAAGFGGGGR